MVVSRTGHFIATMSAMDVSNERDREFGREDDRPTSLDSREYDQPTGLQSNAVDSVVEGRNGNLDAVSETALDEAFDDANGGESILRRAYDLIERATRFRPSSSFHEDNDAEPDPAVLSHVENATSEVESGVGLSRAAARGQAKAASAFVASNNGGKHLHRLSLRPGAQYVESRAPGLSPSFYLGLIRRNSREAGRQQSARQEGATAESLGEIQHERSLQQASQTIYESDPLHANISQARITVIDGELMEPESDQNRKIHNPWVRRAALLLLVLVGGAVVAGVTVFERKSTTVVSLAVTTQMSPPTTSCQSWYNQKQPSVITQCLCIGKVTIVASDVNANYQRLIAGGFIQSVIPGFSSTLDSCDPSNQALLWLASATGSSSPYANLRQRYVMALLYISWNGQQWTLNDNWLSSDTECSWKGIVCDRFGEVTQLDLYNNQVMGHLGADFSLLTSLEVLSLGQNGIQGSLPSELGYLTSLTSLVVELNQLIGSLPSELVHVSLLQELRLRNNRLTGVIPTWLGQLSNLQTLSLSNNTFTPMQSKLGKQHDGSLSAGDSKRNAFPSEMGLLSYLQLLQLSFTGLIGTIPTEIFNLGNSLTSLDVSFNSLSGTIPGHLGNLVNLGKSAVFCVPILAMKVCCSRMIWNSFSWLVHE